MGHAVVMGIGVGIFLIVVGAILTFALHATLAGVDLRVVGWILMLAGVAGLVLFFYFWNRRRVPHTKVTESRSYDDAGQPPA
jgi:Na+/melibiose symporter-like transporter